MAEKEFRKQLLKMVNKELPADSLKEEGRQLMKLFLEWGSETDDNVNCFKHIEFGRVSNRDCGPRQEYGLKIKGKRILLADVAHTIEDVKLPSEVKERWSDITESEWDAATRMITMVLRAFQQYKE